MTNNIFFKPEMFTDLYQCKKKKKAKSRVLSRPSEAKYPR